MFIVYYILKFLFYLDILNFHCFYTLVTRALVLKGEQGGEKVPLVESVENLTSMLNKFRI